MIYSASRRTDLPAFYPDYIVEKIRRSRRLEGVVYWTKDIRNFVDHCGLQAAVLSYPTIIQYTVTGLAVSDWEPRIPSLSQQSMALKELNQILPKGAIRWRFDPIIVDDTLYNRLGEVLDFFANAGVELDGVTVSFPDLYKKVAKRLRNANMTMPLLSLEEKIEVLEEIHNRSGLTLRLCCEDELLGLPFVKQSSCIDNKLFDKLYGVAIAGGRDRGQRAGCGCSISTDIGSYESECGHDCLYCYATPERDLSGL